MKLPDLSTTMKPHIDLNSLPVIDPRYGIRQVCESNLDPAAVDHRIIAVARKETIPMNRPVLLDEGADSFTLWEFTTRGEMTRYLGGAPRPDEARHRAYGGRRLSPHAIIKRGESFRYCEPTPRPA